MGDNPYGRVKVVETLGDNMVDALSNRVHGSLNPVDALTVFPVRPRQDLAEPGISPIA